MTNTTKDITDLTPEECDCIVELFMHYGERLHAKDEWDMDDNFATTEALYALYKEITIPDPTAVYSADYWRYEVANGDTMLGYQDWVFHMAEADAV